MTSQASEYQYHFEPWAQLDIPFSEFTVTQVTVSLGDSKISLGEGLVELLQYILAVIL